MKEKHRCPNCARVERLDSSKAQWCACFPNAPFRMVPISISRLTENIGSSLKAFTCKNSTNTTHT